MNNLTIPSIKKDFVVETPQDKAFKVFTENIDKWWPRTHHIGATPMTEMVLEPRVNGRWFTRHEDGSEADIGTVLTWDPYGLIVLSWQINGVFKYVPGLVTEVEVQFIPEGSNRTRVKFEHKDLDRLGEGVHTSGMDEGWGYIMGLYKAEAEK